MRQVPPSYPMFVCFEGGSSGTRAVAPVAARGVRGLNSMHNSEDFMYWR